MSNTRIRRDLPNDEYQAAVGANNASAANVFATIADLTAGTGDADRVVFDAKYDQVGGIIKGQAVYISGSDGTNITVSKADYSTEATSSKTLGLAVLSGANNFQGQVISDGLLDGIDTSAAGAAGDPVWLGDDGNLLYGLANKPYAPNHLVFIGIVTKKNPSTGEIFVKVQNGFELDEIHNVDVKSSLPTDGQVLTYDSVTGLWRNESLPNTTLTSAGGTETLVNDGTGPSLATKGITAGTGISLSSTATELTVTNSAPDQTVVLNAGTGIGVTGTYPNFTISNTDPTSAVTLTSAGGVQTLVNDGTGPSLAVKGLTGGAGVTLSSNASSISIAADNIYNTDGTLSGNRIVTMGSNTLTFDGTDSNLLYQPNSVGGDLRVEGSASGLPRVTTTIPANVPLGKPATGVQFGMRAWDDVSFPGYGAAGDAFIYVGNETNGLNIANPAGTGTADYIRLFAGLDASGTADIHIQGTGVTRGHIGVGTNTPSEKLDVIGKVKATGLQVTTSPTSGYVLTSDASGNATWQPAGAGGTGYSATLNFQTQVLATSASNTIYVIGGNANYAPNTLANDSPRYRVRTPIEGSIKSVQFSIYIQGTLAGSGNCTLRVVNVTQNTFANLTTTYTMSSGALQGGARNDHFVLASPLAVNEGDEIQIRLITPTWITAPTNIFHNGQVYITN